MPRLFRLVKHFVKAMCGVVVTFFFISMLQPDEPQVELVTQSAEVKAILTLKYGNETDVNIIRNKTDYTWLYHTYDTPVDLRIIVMTFNRPKSLYKTLNSLQEFVTDGHKVSLEIWIDKGADAPDVDAETLQIARDFRWTNGPANVWIHTRHMGLFGQWLYTWRPRATEAGVDMNEWALFVEDDVDVSKFGYRWLRAVHAGYKSRDDVACYTLQDDNAIVSSGKHRNKEIIKPTHSSIFFHRLPGSWAMAPHPAKWRLFQDWYELQRKDKTFRPYSKEAAIHTEWYKIFEKDHREDTMWTMWYIYYTSQNKQICVYANLPTFTGHVNISLASNRKEPGLHYNKKMVYGYKPPGLMTSWNDSYVNFPSVPPVFGFDGKMFRPK